MCNRKVNPNAKKRPELREPVQPADGEKVTHFRCKKYDFTRLAPIFHKNWARHCNDHHKGEDDDAGDTNDDAGDKKDDGDDDVDQPGRRVAGDGADAATRQRAVKGGKEAAEPKKPYGPKRSEPPAAAPVRRQRGLAGDQGTQKARKPKGKAACKKKSKPE